MAAQLFQEAVTAETMEVQPLRLEAEATMAVRPCQEAELETTEELLHLEAEMAETTEAQPYQEVAMAETTEEQQYLEAETVSMEARPVHGHGVRGSTVAAVVTPVARAAVLRSLGRVRRQIAPAQDLPLKRFHAIGPLALILSHLAVRHLKQ